MLENRREEPLVQLIEQLGGWPIINPHWNQSDFDWLELMAKLRLYNNDILISEWVGPDIKNSDEYVIQVSKSFCFIYSVALPLQQLYGFR